MIDSVRKVRGSASSESLYLCFFKVTNFRLKAELQTLVFYAQSHFIRGIPHPRLRRPTITIGENV